MTTITAPDQNHSTIPWWVVLLEGIAAIIIGLLLLTSPATTTIVLIQLLGIYWLIAGILQIVAIFIDSSMWGWKLFAGVLGIIAGIIILQHPLWSALLVPATLAILLGITGILIGVIKLINAFQGGGWGVGILGLLSIILGIILLGNIQIATLTLSIVLGIFAILGGIIALVGAFGLKGGQAEQEASETAQTTTEDTRTAELATSEIAATAVADALPEETVVEEAPTIEQEAPLVEAIELSKVPDAVEQALASLSPEVLKKLNDSPEYVEGIGPVYSQTLKGIGISTLLALLKHGATPKGRAEIVERSGISSKLILEWVNRIDLNRIKGVGSEYADLLEAAGVDTVVELATRNPANLHGKLTAVNEEKKLVRRLPDLSQVQEWVKQAKELPRVISY